MGKKIERPIYSEGDRPSGEFPPTDTGLLASAAAGNWVDFFQVYLRPCWNSVVAACRARGLTLHDTDDLFQNLVLRLMSPGKFAAKTHEKFGDAELQAFLGNLPARYLRHRELPVPSARFRTYLKNVIEKLLSEAFRQRRRQPQQAPEDLDAEIAVYIDQSISKTFDSGHFRDALSLAATRLRDDSARATTKGRQRMYDVFFQSLVQQRSPGLIACEFGLDRTTVAGLLKSARERFAEHVRKACGAESTDEVQRWLSGCPQLVAEAVASVQPLAPTRGRSQPLN